MLCNVFVGWEMCKAAVLEGVVAELWSFSYFVVLTWGVSSLDMGTWMGKWHTAILLILHPKTSISMLHLRNVGREEPIVIGVVPFCGSVCPGWNGPIACSCQRSAVVIESPMLFQISWQHQLHLKNHVTMCAGCPDLWFHFMGPFCVSSQGHGQAICYSTCSKRRRSQYYPRYVQKYVYKYVYVYINMEHIKWRCHWTAASVLKSLEKSHESEKCPSFFFVSILSKCEPKKSEPFKMSSKLLLFQSQETG